MPQDRFWKRLDSRFLYVARELSGTWFAYTERPYLKPESEVPPDENPVWEIRSGVQYLWISDAASLAYLKRYETRHWTDTLIERPSQENPK